jgi:hypothetical protein
MAQTINLKKRLIGKEDINFDITGTGEVENIFTSDGNRKTLSKLNASHVPLLQATRNKVNAVNVDDALNKLSDKIDNFEAQDVLTDDLVIEFLPEDDTETIQNTINQQKKNLNSHTLTFLFPPALQQNLYATLEWKDFYNGTVVIAGGSEDSKIAVYDRQDITSLFRVLRCQCEVRIRYFYFVHQYSLYAVSAESSTAVIFEKCLFSGIAKEDSYAVNKIAANAILVDCELNDDKEFFPEEQNGMGKSLGEIFAFPGAVPPEGAYLLNGQTIAGCNELYPKFWAWLIDNAGEMRAVPVYKAWTMPALTADGTLGGAEYAAAASSKVVSGYDAYKSFDGVLGASSTYAAMSSVKSGFLTWYSPVKLKIARINFQNRTTTGTPANHFSSFAIYGSNDNATWTELASGAYNSTANSAIQTVEIPESKFNADTPGYHYLKIEGVNGGGSNTDFPEITIYGQEYLYTDYASNGNILTLSNEAYEYTLARTGVCGGFVVDTVAGSVRLPTLVNGTLWGADSGTIGQSLAAGLPNITGNFNGNQLIDDDAAAVAEFNGAFKSGDISRVSMSGSSDKSQMGIGFDASRSNPIYGNSDTVQPPAIRVSWCIQVFNAATSLSEQESAQLAVLMQTKAQTDLANVNSNIDYVVESWNDGAGGWYRKYRSGWVEQGGVVEVGAKSKDFSVALFVEYSNTNYNVLPYVLLVDKTGDYRGDSSASAYGYTETGFSMTAYSESDTINTVGWEAKGYAATE